jgi:hypothetical protein
MPSGEYEITRTAKLRTAKLRTAKLRTAKLRTAKLRTAKLRIAKLRTAKLRIAKLRTAKLRTAKLRIAKLRTAVKLIPPGKFDLPGFSGTFPVAACAGPSRVQQPHFSRQLWKEHSP